MRMSISRILLPALLSLACYSCGGGGSSSPEKSADSNSLPNSSLASSEASSPLSTATQSSVLSSISLSSTPSSGISSNSLSSTQQSSSLFSSAISLITQSSSLSLSSSSQALSSSASLNKAPEFSWVFPKQNATTTSAKVIVRGTASDDKGIASIQVNGVAATIVASPITTSAITSSQPSLRLQKMGPTDANPSNNTQVEWEVALDLDYGDIPLVVEVTDTDGATADTTGKEILLRNIRMPIYLLDDAANNRFLGSNYNSDNIAIDKDTHTISELPYLNINESSILNANASRVYSAIVYDGILNIEYRDIAQGVATKVIDIDLGLDHSKFFANVYSGTYSAATNMYYILIHRIPINNSALTESLIMQIDLDDNSYSIMMDSNKDSSSPFVADDIKFAGDKLYALQTQSFSQGDNLWSIDLNSGARTKIGGDFYILASRMAIDSDYKNIYVAGYKNVAKINLESNAIELISEDKAHSPYNVAQVRLALLDEKNQQLLIGDSSVNDVLSVALQDGSRNYYIATGIGTGPKPITARQVALNADKTYAYLFDDGGNAPTRIMKVDLSNGNRTILIELDLIYNEFANGLILDEAEQQLYTATGAAIGRFDLNSKTYEVLATVDNISDLSGLVLDKNNNRLLYSGKSGIIASLDLDTLTSVDLFNTTQGKGPSLTGNIAMTLDTTHQQLIIKNFEKHALFTLNLETGERALLLSTCEGENGTNLFDWDTHTEMNYDAASNSVLMTADFNLVSIDLTTATCRYTPSASSTPLDTVQLNNDIALEVSFNSLHLVDFKTSQSLTISR